jgi:hypothetical protein
MIWTSIGSGLSDRCPFAFERDTNSDPSDPTANNLTC